MRPLSVNLMERSQILRKGSSPQNMIFLIRSNVNHRKKWGTCGDTVIQAMDKTICPVSPSTNTLLVFRFTFTNFYASVAYNVQKCVGGKKSVDHIPRAEIDLCSM